MKLNNKQFLIICLPILAAHLLISCSEQKGQTAKQKQDEHTIDDPGRWEGMEDNHYPDIRWNKSNNIIEISVNLKSKDPNHIIEKIGVMDASKKDLAVKSFDQKSKSTLQSIVQARFDGDLFSGSLKEYKVFVKCSMHDLWIRPLEHANYSSKVK